MRITVAFLFSSLSLFAHAGADAVGYCTIPRLEPGVPTMVEVPYIEKPFCGTAIINQQYVRMESFAKVTESSELRCSSDDLCTRVIRYFRDEAKATPPYILIFRGPKYSRNHPVKEISKTHTSS